MARTAAWQGVAATPRPAAAAPELPAAARAGAPERVEDGPAAGADAGLLQRYLEHVRVEKRLAQRTVTLYTLDLQKLQQHAAGAGVALLAVRSQNIRRWVAAMHGAGRSARGIALILSGWRGFYTWAGRQGLVRSNPVQDVRAPKPGKPLPKALGVDEAVQFASYQGTGDAWLEARDAAMVELMYGSGLRVGELVGLDVQAGAQALGWIDLDAAQAHVLGKGSKRRELPVGGLALQALHAWLALRGMGAGNSRDAASNGARALFQGRNGTRLSAQAVWQRLRQRSLQAGVATPVHPHMLRHSFASHMLQSSGDLRAVQELLGHANISTTQVYTRLDFQHLARAYDAAHPRARLKPGPDKKS